MISGVSQNDTSTSGAGSNPGKTASTANSTVSKNMFLQLLVSQIKNQDPLNPTDGVQFLTQLAQFQQLEQGMNLGQDIAAIRSDLDQAAGNTTGANNQ